ncbi:ArgJ-like domain [Phytophthora cactorum]|nr:ArgJ-like domain [Phytophthora cactorum]
MTILRLSSLFAKQHRKSPHEMRSLLQTRCLSTHGHPFVFDSRHEYMDYLEAHQSRLPWGFAVATTKFDFPTSLFAAVFTQNAFPGAPVLVGRKRLNEPKLGAILVNNKISNVCASGGGVADAEEVCENLAKHLRLDGGSQVLPCSTGVIGWRIPVDAMVENLPKLVNGLQSDSVLPAAEGIMTTDLYPKIRSMDVCGGRVVGIAKGAGMIEPNMATMLSYILTDLSIPRDVLRQLLTEVVGDTYNSLSVDTDQSTSDTVTLVSSDQIPFDMKQLDEFKKALHEVCLGLSEDIVRNGEGAHHVMRVHVSGALSKEMAKGVGKSVVNSPLLKCAYMGLHHKDVNIQRRMKIRMGGVLIFENGEMVLNDDIEAKLVAHMRDAMLIEPTRGGLDASSHNYPPHGKFVEMEIDLGVGAEETQVLGIDLTHEYVAINADYRS